MDINLPGIDGVAAGRRLVENPATAHIPVIAVTGAAMSHDMERMTEGHFVACLTKPFSIKQAFDTLESALRSANPRAQGSA